MLYVSHASFHSKSKWMLTVPKNKRHTQTESIYQNKHVKVFLHSQRWFISGENTIGTLRAKKTDEFFQCLVYPYLSLSLSGAQPAANASSPGIRRLKSRFYASLLKYHQRSTGIYNSTLIQKKLSRITH